MFTSTKGRAGHEKIYRLYTTCYFYNCYGFICDCRLLLPDLDAIIKLHLLGYIIMTDSTVNYTPEMVAILEAAQPITYEKAKELAIQISGMGHGTRGLRSVVAKACKMNIYQGKPARARKKAAPSKMDMVAAICSALDMDTCEGLEKSTGSALNKLLSNLA